MTTLDDVMNDPSWPKCERCHVRPAAITITEEELCPETAEKNQWPSYGLPPWCSQCLEEGNFEGYWREQAKKQYQTGERQS